MKNVTITTAELGAQEHLVQTMDEALNLIQQLEETHTVLSVHIEDYIATENKTQSTTKVLTTEQKQINELYKKHKRLVQYNQTRTEKAYTPATFKVHVNIHYHTAVCQYIMHNKQVPDNDTLREIYKKQQHKMLLLYRSKDIYAPLNKKKGAQ